MGTSYADWLQAQMAKDQSSHISDPAVTQAAITDNSGGTDPGDDTIAVIAGRQRAGNVYLPNVAAAGTSGAADQYDLTGGNGSMANLVQPVHPRNVVINFTDGDAGITEFTVTVNGTAPDGTVVSEAFTFAGGLDQTGSVVFATITSIVLTDLAGAGAGDTLDVGYGVKLGLPLPYGSTGLSIVKLAAGGTLEAAAATDTTNNSFTSTTAPDGAVDFEVWFEYVDPVAEDVTAAVALLAAACNAIIVDCAANNTAIDAINAALEAAEVTADS